MTRVVAFIVGATATLLVHQPLVWAAHRWLDTPWIAFAATPTHPFGVPAVGSTAVWGGAWAAFLIRWWRVRHTSTTNVNNARHEVSRTAAAITCAVIPTAFGAVLMQWSTRFPPLGAHPVRAAFAALAINALWGLSVGVLVRALHRRRAASPPRT